MKAYTQESRRKKAIKTENRLRVALYYAFQLFVDVIIILIFVRAFSASFNFAHEIFYDSAKNIKSKEIIEVTIPPDSSTSVIASTLYDAGVVKNKYVMIAKIKVNEVGGKIKAGTYQLSPSMKYSEILNIITGVATANTDDEKKKTQVSTATDASEIHDNSEVGAGEGSEGDDYTPEDGGDDAGSDEE